MTGHLADLLALLLGGRKSRRHRGSTYVVLMKSGDRVVTGCFDRRHRNRLVVVVWVIARGQPKWPSSGSAGDCACGISSQPRTSTGVSAVHASLAARRCSATRLCHDPPDEISRLPIGDPFACVESVQQRAPVHSIAEAPVQFAYGGLRTVGVDQRPALTVI